LPGTPETVLPADAKAGGGMNIIQRRDIIRTVRDRWNSQYPDDNLDIGWERSERVGDIRVRLAALDLETCSVEDVDKAIGTSGWADNDCDCCKLSFPVLVHIGEEPDYDAKWQDLCAGCLSKAVTLLNEAVPLP
jgi:hypothetical protein